jgi:hypothetical protein
MVLWKRKEVIYGKPRGRQRKGDFMGGRGAAGGLVSGTKLEYGGRSMSIFKFLNQDDIRRANDASITDMGDIIKRMFLSNSKEINNFELSSQEKKRRY